MAKIGVLVDADPGHIYPAIGLAFKIQTLGHEAQIYGIKDIESYFFKYELTFHVILEDEYPKGYIEKMKRKNSVKYNTEDKMFRDPYILSILNDKYAELFEKDDIHCLAISYFCSPIALLLKNRNPALPIFFFTTFLRFAENSPKDLARWLVSNLEENLQQRIVNKFNISDFDIFFNQLDSIEEIIMCPKEFDNSDKKLGPKVHYTSPFVRPNLTYTNFIEKLSIPKNKKIIYVSLGTQAGAFREKALKIFKSMIELMALKSSTNWFMILAVGDVFSNQNFRSVKNSIEVVNWAPQLEILGYCDLIVTHGGLGTIKESIVNAVPMLVLPLGLDQIYNGQLVQEKKLGYSLNIDEVGIKDIRNTIENILVSENLKKRIEYFQKIFTKKNSIILKQIIENNLNN